MIPATISLAGAGMPPHFRLRSALSYCAPLIVNGAEELFPKVATPLIARMRTTDAATIDEGMLLEVEASLMKLSDTVTTNYFTTRARSDAPWDSLG